MTNIGDSTEGWNTSAAALSGSETSPTTLPAASSKPADSDPNYTLDCEEPLKGTVYCLGCGYRLILQHTRRRERLYEYFRLITNEGVAGV